MIRAGMPTLAYPGSEGRNPSGSGLPSASAKLRGALAVEGGTHARMSRDGAASPKHRSFNVATSSCAAPEPAQDAVVHTHTKPTVSSRRLPACDRRREAQYG